MGHVRGRKENGGNNVIIFKQINKNIKPIKKYNLCDIVDDNERKLRSGRVRNRIGDGTLKMKQIIMKLLIPWT